MVGCVWLCCADAVFDGGVTVTLTGSEGTTAELRLPADPSRAYNPGQTDTFTLKASDVWALQSVTVVINATGEHTQVRPRRAVITHPAAATRALATPCGSAYACSRSGSLYT